MRKCAISGIYKVTNKVNGKIYIGQSKDCMVRKCDHWKQYKNINNPKNHLRLYEDMRKYGRENFTFEILEKCDVSMLNERESYWISYYSERGTMYNIEHNNHAFFLENNPNKKKPIVQKSLDGKEVAQYDCIYSAVKAINKEKYGRSNVRQALQGKISSAYGYKWEYI